MTELQKHSLVIGARNRWYYVIVMPLTDEGYGPASEELGEVRKITWEIWTQDLSSVGSFDYLADAIDECERLNVEWDKENGR